MSIRRFFVLFAIVFGIAFGSAVVLNYWVDPYDLDIAPGRTAPPTKRETGSHGRLHKAYALIRLEPSVVALGASRTEAAIRMDHAGWLATPAERYNASVTAATLREVWAFLQLASTTGKLRQVLIGLEFYSFNAFAPNRPDFESALMNGAPERVLGIDPVKARYYLSFDGMVSSLRTLATQSSVPHFLLDGTVNPDALEESYHGHAGQRTAFLLADSESLQLYYLPPPRHLYSFEDGKGFSSIALYRQILDLARAKHIDLRLYISPGHARSMETVRMLALEKRFEQWQRELVRVTEEEAVASGGAPFPLWDFSAPSTITNEPVPVDDPNGPRSKWYWESSHYRAAVGDLVLDRIFDTPNARRPVPSGFGVRLDSATISTYQAAARAAREAYRIGNAAELAELAAISY